MSILAQTLLLLVIFLAADLLIGGVFFYTKKRKTNDNKTTGHESPPLGFSIMATAILAILSAMSVTIFHAAGLTIERHGGLLWLAVLAAAAISGIIPTYKYNKLSPAWLLTALIICSEIAFAIIYPHYAEAGIASPQLRMLVAAPLACGLSMEVAACLAYLLRGYHGNWRRSQLERLIAWRFVKAKKTAALSTVTFISICGVTLGVALMIVSIGVLSGFERDMIDKMIGANAHLTVSTYSGYQITDYNDKVNKLNELSQVTAAYPYLMGEVMVASDTNMAGAMMFGVERDKAAKVINIFDKIELGNSDFLEPSKQQAKKTTASPLPGITLRETGTAKVLIGAELMRILSADVGDTIRIVSPMHEELSPVGPIPKSRSFTVGGVFNSQMYEYDSKFIYIPLEAAQNFFDAEETVSGLGIKLKHAQDVDTAAPEVLKTVGGYPHRVHNWKAKNEALLASVELEKVVTFVVLIFIVLVASFSIINTLTMSVMEKGQAIALFKAMGASDLIVMKIFVYQGLIIGGLGTTLGAALGTLLCAVIKTFGVWLDSEVYYIDKLPVYLEAGDVLLIVISALAITFLAAVFPSRLAERYNPVEGLRDG